MCVCVQVCALPEGVVDLVSVIIFSKLFVLSFIRVILASVRLFLCLVLSQSSNSFFLFCLTSVVHFDNYLVFFHICFLLFSPPALCMSLY